MCFTGNEGEMPARPWLHPEGAGRSLPPFWLLHPQSVFITTPGLRAPAVPLSPLTFFSALIPSFVPPILASCCKKQIMTPSSLSLRVHPFRSSFTPLRKEEQSNVLWREPWSF